MQCPKCQFENPEESKFCGECGTKLEKTCPKCNFINPPTYKFCGDCGYDFNKTLRKLSSVNFTQPKSYTPQHLADKILTTRSSIEGERKFVTVLFADVANYTSITERLDPEEVHQIMDGCFNILMTEIHKYEGTINQFTGDGVMALFGAPVAHEDHAQRACRSALAIQAALEKYHKKLKLRFDIQFKMRIGINSGLVVVGSIGDDLRMDYTAVGDTTNLASRIENRAEPGSIFLSEKTKKIVKDFFELKNTGEIKIKGKERLQRAYRLIRVSNVETRIGASQAKGLTRFVGRKNSMNVLLNTFEKVKSGFGQVVGIVGEAGVGKSRLLLEMRNVISGDNFGYYEGRCLQYGGSILYLPILDVLKSVFEIKDNDREAEIKRKICETLISFNKNFKYLNTFFQDIFSLAIDDKNYTKLEPKEKREKLFEAIRDLLIRIAQGKPLVLAVEDLHWIDKTSEEFLNYFIDWLPNTQILLILLYRPEYIHHWGSKSYYTKIGVDQLTMHSSKELVRSILEEGEISVELNDLILSRSTGNPLFMEEFTHTLLENGSIEKKDNNYGLKSGLRDIQVPDTIQGIIAARIDRLEDNLKRTMQVASVIGRDFAFKILQAIMGMKSELKSYLLNLQGLEFIYEKSLFPELEYIFKHALTQEVAYGSLLRKRRMEIHEKIGNAIEKLYADRIEKFYEITAYHYSKSNLVVKAIKYFKLSGHKAMKSHSLMEAYEFYKQGIDLLINNFIAETADKNNFDIFSLICIPMRLLGYPKDSIQILKASKEFLSNYGKEKELSPILTEVGVYYLAIGEQDQAKRNFENSYQIATKSEDINLIAPISLELVVFYFFVLNEIKTASEMTLTAMSLIEKYGKEDDFFGSPVNVYSSLQGIYGSLLGYLGKFIEGERYCEKAFLRASQINDLRGLGFIESYHGMLLNFKGDGESAIKHLKNSLKYFEKTKWTGGLIGVLMNLAWAYHLIEDMESALFYSEKGIKLALETKVGHILHIQYLITSLIYINNNDLVNAKKYIKKVLSSLDGDNVTTFHALSQIIMGKILWHDNSSKKDALNYILNGIKTIEAQQAKPFLGMGYFYLGELYAEFNQKEDALKNLRIAKELFHAMEMLYWHRKTKDVLNKISE